jgi:hypothetical protein
MASLKATTTRTDQDRAARLMLAWIAGDKFAFDIVLTEVMDDPTGSPGVLFSLLAFTTRLGQSAAPDFKERLEARLLDGQDDGTVGQGDN